MVLANYWKYLQGISAKHYTVGEGMIEASTGCKATDGTTNMSILIGSNGYSDKLSQNLAPRENIKFIVGTGNTAPTAADYALASDVSSSFTDYQANFVFTTENGSYDMIATVSGMNNTADDITISEVGLEKGVYDQLEQMSKYVLFVRELLATPVTVPAGGNFAFVFKWSEG